MSFNRELTERIKCYMATRHGMTISNEQSEEYLDALADLYEAFTELVQNKK